MLHRIPGLIGRLGTAARRNIGTSAGQVPVLDASARLPAVDGSQLTNISSSGTVTNFVINGRFDIDQRNAGVETVVADAAYGPDRWKMLGEDSNGKLKAIDTTVGGGRHNLAIKCVTANKKYGVVQYFEGVNCKHLRGKTVNLSANLSVSNARLGNIKMAIVEWTGTEDVMTSDMISAWNGDGVTPTLAASFAFSNTPANLAVTTTPASYSVSATLGSSFNNLAVFIWNDDQTFTANDLIYPTDVQLEVGAAASAFVALPTGTVTDLCQRYYWRRSSNTATLAHNDGIAMGQVYNTTTTFGFVVNLPTTMRAAPTIGISALGDFSITNSGGIGVAVTSGVIFDSASPSMIYNWSSATSSSLSGTAGFTTFLAFNSTTAWFDAKAEL